MVDYLMILINFVWSQTLTMLANDPIKLNNVINTCLINPNIILYYFFLLSVYEYPEYYQHQYFHN